MLNFEWDNNKANENLLKHDVSFEEAKTVFSDFSALIFDDNKDSESEKRELIIGISINNRILMTCFTMRKGKIRIISSRLTNKKEKKKYEENR